MNTYFNKVLDIFKKLKITPKKKILSVGCGTGDLENFLSKELKINIDCINEPIYTKKTEKFKFNHHNKNINYWEANFIDYKFKKYDVLYFQNSLFIILKIYE